MKSSIASGAGWMVLFKLVDRILGAVSTLVLARLLVPEDFGLVAMAMSVLAIVELATSFNFEIALIQRHEVDRVHYDSAWTLNLLFGVACGVIAALLAYPTSLFYSEPRLTSVLLVLACAWFVGGFENIGIVDFRRRLDFRKEFYFLTAKRLSSFALILVLALSLQSYWALVLGSVAGKLIAVALSFAFHPFRPRLSLRAARELIGFSGWMLLSNLAIVLQRKVPHFVVGRSLGADALGLFTIGTEIAQLPSSDLIAPINRALFPGFSRMTQDLPLLRSTFLDVTGIVAFLALPAAAGIGAIAEPLVRALLGERWLGSVPIIQVLSMATAISVLSANNSSAFLAIGKPRQWTIVVALRLALLVPLAVILTRNMGLLGAALAELLTSIVFLAVSISVLFNQLNLSYSELLSRVWRPLISSALMAAGVQVVLHALPAGDWIQLTIQLMVAMLSGAVMYISAALVLWFAVGRPRSSESILLGRLRESMTGSKRAR